MRLGRGDPEPPRLVASGSPDKSLFWSQTQFCVLFTCCVTVANWLHLSGQTQAQNCPLGRAQAEGRPPDHGIPSSYSQSLGPNVPSRGARAPKAPPLGRKRLPSSPTDGRGRPKEAKPPGEESKKGKGGSLLARRLVGGNGQARGRPRQEDASSCSQLFQEGSWGMGFLEGRGLPEGAG